MRRPLALHAPLGITFLGISLVVSAVLVGAGLVPFGIQRQGTPARQLSTGC